MLDKFEEIDFETYVIEVLKEELEEVENEISTAISTINFNVEMAKESRRRKNNFTILKKNLENAIEKLEKISEVS